MKIFLIAAVTADGFIAKNESHAATWTSKADKAFFKEATKRAGCVVMGSKTYETINRPLPDRRTIVLSRSKTYEGVETSTESPTDLVSRLEREGVRELAICGGSHIYSSFMKADLVNTAYITVEPLFFGQGVSLFSEVIDARLELKEARPLDGGAVLLEYSVIKS